MSATKKAALDYHKNGRPGKIEVISSKPCATAGDLALAYSPGVAEPCLEIKDNPEAAYDYTAKGNLVGVISNGTAVLGLGNIGALAGKPVMEGKGILLKRFADIDVFDIEVDTQDPDEFINAVKLLEPTFGGINLEDIKAPDCFYIEEELKKVMKIPVFHDDQHGTAIILCAAFLNAIEITGKYISKVKVVFNGAGAAAIACANLLMKFNVPRENIFMVDTEGVIYKNRPKGMNPYKDVFAHDIKERTLSDVMNGADVFVGLSKKGAVTKDMVKSMNKTPMIFAMANPDPEITYEEVKEVRSDFIFGTGRSDYPNQVNNVLCFPYIFRGALDVRATTINEEMKMAAVFALSRLAKEDVPESVSRAYGNEKFEFGLNYIIPKPFDPRVLLWVAPAVAKAAMETGVAKKHIAIDDYIESLERRLGKSREMMRDIINKSKKRKIIPKIVFPEGNNLKILEACNRAMEEGIAEPILLGNIETIKAIIEEKEFVHLKNASIISPYHSPEFLNYVETFFKIRSRKGVTMESAREIMKIPNYYGSMMLYQGRAAGLVSGVDHNYPDTIKPALQIIGSQVDIPVCGLYIVLLKDRVLFFADTTVNINPTAEDLAAIAISTADEVKHFDIDPTVAMLSFSNFGSNTHSFALKMKKATDLVKRKRPDIKIDGEMQADTALTPAIIQENYPFCEIKNGANVLIFPNLESGNIAYKLMQRIGGAEVIGPILMGMKKPVHVLQKNSDATEILNMIAITAIDIHKTNY